ncbi:MAG: sulfite exporter TauE/SafE family protein [Cryobacterium sp.]|nr:sulfite exporter TauE/SafE family protein [Cryobacterium sp.]
MLRLALIGVIGGFFSGLFGVGGGIILVPLLVLMLGYGQRLASGTSLAAILPTAIAGTITYASSGSIDWIAGACLGGGAVVGSLLGTWMLHRIRQRLLRWMFIVFLLAVAVRMFFYVPDRDIDLQIDPWIALALVGIGVVVGILSGLLGVGGGVVVVPTLMILFGVSDLIAKGTSLLMMIPTTLVGTVANARRGHVDLRGAAIVGVLAVVAAVGGSLLAVVLPPLLGSILFALLLVYSALQLAWNALRSRGE